MAGAIEKRLQELGVTLPDAPAPAANYIPAVLSGSTLYVSGQLPFGPDGLALKGTLGAGVSIEDANKAAKLCAINILSQASAALGGDLGRIKRLIKLNGFVASVPEFGEQHLVINGASNLLATVLGEAGKHARAAVGMAALPFNAAVEIDAVMEIAV